MNLDYNDAAQRIFHASEASDGLIVELRNGKPPSREEVESICKALKCIYDAVSGERKIDRSLASALFGLAFYSNEYANLLSSELQGAIEFKDVLRFDLQMAVESIFLGEWIEQQD